jgi:hypothetical protein
MAVHFCPAFTVISVATSLMNRSNSGVPGAASGPRSEALRLSCSATKRTDSRMTVGCVRSLSAVCAEPVIDAQEKLCGIVSLGDLAREADPDTAEQALEGVAQPGRQHQQ